MDQLPSLLLRFFQTKLFFSSGYGGFSVSCWLRTAGVRTDGLVCERSYSFPRESFVKMTLEKFRRMKTETDLLRCSGMARGESFSPERASKLTKMLVNVRVEGSLGAVRVVMPAESTVSNLIKTSLQKYKKEGRRPILPTMDPSRFELHYSEFCLESLDKEDKLVALDSRNFFLCPKSFPVDSQSGKMPPGEIKIEWSDWLNFSDFLM